MRPLHPPSPEVLARLRAVSERQLSAEEVREALALPLGEAEEEESRALIRWFCRRYPTPAERLAYVRRAHRRWARARDLTPGPATPEERPGPGNLR